MNQNTICSHVQRFFYCLPFITCLAFAKADAQQSSSNSNETSHILPSFKIVDINLIQYVNLEIRNGDDEHVKLITSQDGEYKNAVILSSEVRNDSLLIKDPFNPSFSYPQDKLSAHKIIDGTAVLYLPANKKVVINARSADIHITGVYQNVYINQLSGNCVIDKLRGNLNFTSVYASISLNLPYYSIESSSKSGKVAKFKKPIRVMYFAKIETISGNINQMKQTNK